MLCGNITPRAPVWSACEAGWFPRSTLSHSARLRAHSDDRAFGGVELTVVRVLPVLGTIPAMERIATDGIWCGEIGEGGGTVAIAGAGTRRTPACAR